MNKKIKKTCINIFISFIFIVTIFFKFGTINEVFATEPTSTQISNIISANIKATNAINKANSAVSVAQSALTSANNLINKLNNYKSSATNLANAENYFDFAESATEYANIAKEKADAARILVNDAMIAASDANALVDPFSSSFSIANNVVTCNNNFNTAKALNTTVTSLVTNANNAVSSASASLNDSSTQIGSFTSAGSNDWWGKAFSFFGEQNSSGGTADISALTSLIAVIKVLGNAVFIIVTIFLGIKYMYGSVEGKVDVKEGLFTLVVAMMFFYGGTTLTDLFVTSGKFVLIGDTANGTIFNIYSLVLYIAKFIAIGGIIYVGVKYMMASADGKANIKDKGVSFFIGVIMVFATLSFLSVIQTILNDIIK